MGNSHNKPQREHHDEEESLLEFTCEICTESVPSNKRFTHDDDDKSNTCIHHFCLDCISKYIEVKVQDNVGKIKCPDLKCHEFLDPLAVRPILPHGIFVKWCDNLCNLFVQEHETCYCPYKSCSALIIYECSIMRLNQSQCPNCKRDFCFDCMAPWHDGTNCDKQIDENDTKFVELVTEKGWTKCPGCGNSVDRIRGCRKVICRCGALFCHECGKRMQNECKCRHNSTAHTLILLGFAIAKCALHIWFVYSMIDIDRRAWQSQF